MKIKKTQLKQLILEVIQEGGPGSGQKGKCPKCKGVGRIKKI